MSAPRIVTISSARCHRCDGLVAVLELEIPAGPRVRPRLRWRQRERTCACGTTNLPPVDRLPSSMRGRVRSVLGDAARLRSWETMSPRAPLVMQV